MLKINDIKKNYGDFTLNCSFELEKNVVSGVVGSNGAGKSTLFKAILGLITIDSGTIDVFNQSINSLSTKDKERLGVVMSESGFSEYLDVKSICSILESLYPMFEKDKFNELIQQFSIPCNKRITQFSTGMKAKLKTIIAITHNADLLILDEATSGLDVMARTEILDLLRDYMDKENRSILISSHISSDLEDLCDDIYMLKDGQVIFHETIDALNNEYAVLKLDAKQYERIDKDYLIAIQKVSYGYQVVTNQRQYYLENFKELVIEKTTIDDLIAIMNKGVIL